LPVIKSIEGLGVARLLFELVALFGMAYLVKRKTACQKPENRYPQIAQAWVFAVKAAWIRLGTTAPPGAVVLVFDPTMDRTSRCVRQYEIRKKVFRCLAALLHLPVLNGVVLEDPARYFPLASPGGVSLKQDRTVAKGCLVRLIPYRAGTQ
jgi:hypothetical protein